MLEKTNTHTQQKGQTDLSLISHIAFSCCIKWATVVYLNEKKV